MLPAWTARPACARASRAPSVGRQHVVEICVRQRALRCAIMTSPMTAGMPQSSIRPSRNASTATSLAALSDCRRRPARAARRPAPGPGGKPLQVRRLEIAAARPARGRGIVHRRRCAPATPARGRSACACPGCPSCASTEPSTYSTSECTMLCGWIDHLDAGAGHAEQQAGLDQLQPLVHQRGRVHRDLAAHEPVRMRAGLVRRDACQLLAACRQERATRGGQQDAPHARAAPRPASQRGRQALEDRVVLAVDRQQRRAGAFAPRRRAARPAITSDSLLANSRRLPARAAASVERRPAAPTIAAITLSHFRQRRDLRQRIDVRRAPASAARRREAAAASVGAAVRICDGDVVGPELAGTAAQQRSTLRCAASATTRKRSGCRASTSSVLSPTLPVEPRTATPLHRRSSWMTRPAPNSRQRRRCSQAVDAVEHAAVTGEQRAAVLEAGVALEHAFGQIADDRDQPPTTQVRRTASADRQRRTAMRDRQRQQRPREHAAATPSQVLPGRHGRRQLARARTAGRRNRRRLSAAQTISTSRNSTQQRAVRVEHARCASAMPAGTSTRNPDRARPRAARLPARARRQPHRMRCSTPGAATRRHEHEASAGRLRALRRRHSAQRDRDGVARARAAHGLQPSEARPFPGAASTQHAAPSTATRRQPDQDDDDQHAASTTAVRTRCTHRAAGHRAWPARRSGRSGAARPAKNSSAASSAASSKSRPQRVAEIQLGVGEVPQQEIADALIAAGADEQIRVGQRLPAAAARREPASSIVVGRSAPLATACRELARRLHDVPAAAVTHGHLQLQPRICRGALLGRGHARTAA